MPEAAAEEDAPASAAQVARIQAAMLRILMNRNDTEGFHVSEILLQLQEAAGAPQLSQKHIMEVHLLLQHLLALCVLDPV